MWNLVKIIRGETVVPDSRYRLVSVKLFESVKLFKSVKLFEKLFESVNGK